MAHLHPLTVAGGGRFRALATEGSAERSNAIDVNEQRIPDIVEDARSEMHSQLQREATRLRELQKVNRSVRDDEISLLLEREDALERALGGTRLRLDAVRLIYRGW